MASNADGLLLNCKGAENVNETLDDARELLCVFDASGDDSELARDVARDDLFVAVFLLGDPVELAQVAFAAVDGDVGVEDADAVVVKDRAADLGVDGLEVDPLGEVEIDNGVHVDDDEIGDIEVAREPLGLLDHVCLEEKSADVHDRVPLVRDANDDDLCKKSRVFSA